MNTLQANGTTPVHVVSTHAHSSPRRDTPLIGTMRTAPFVQDKVGVTNLFEPESYFMGTESYEGHPVLYTLLK